MKNLRKEDLSHIPGTIDHDKMLYARLIASKTAEEVSRLEKELDFGIDAEGRLR